MDKTDYVFVGFIIDASIRFLHCADKNDFQTVFGEDGNYLWGKFVDVYERNEGSFICYLDCDNKTLLAKALCDRNLAVVSTYMAAKGEKV